MNWDWRYPIDFIRDEVRKARSKGERETTLDALENVLDQAESIYERLERDHPSDGDFINPAIK